MSSQWLIHGGSVAESVSEQMHDFGVVLVIIH
jgi:hypothetical protein